MKSLLFTLMFVLSGLWAFAQADICHVEFAAGTRNAAFSNSENVNITFDYSVDEPGGVRIFAGHFPMEILLRVMEQVALPCLPVQEVQRCFTIFPEEREWWMRSVSRS